MKQLDVQFTLKVLDSLRECRAVQLESFRCARIATLLNNSNEYLHRLDHIHLEASKLQFSAGICRSLQV
jgi:hypothetical protein